MKKENLAYDLYRAMNHNMIWDVYEHFPRVYTPQTHWFTDEWLTKSLLIKMQKVKLCWMNSELNKKNMQNIKHEKKSKNFVEQKTGMVKESMRVRQWNKVKKTVQHAWISLVRKKSSHLEYFIEQRKLIL